MRSSTGDTKTLSQLESKYEFVTWVGSGAMNTLAVGLDLHSRKEVNIRIAIGQPDSLINEYKTIQAFDHPNIIKVFDLMEWHGNLCFAMEKLDGSSLSSVWKKTRPYIDSFIARAFLQIYNTVQYIHEQGMVHANIHPADILILIDGRVKLIDFALCTLPKSDPNSFSGTPKYMAPERWVGQTRIESDYFAIGTILWEYIRGSNPFQEASSARPFDVAEAILHLDPKRILNEIEDRDLSAIVTDLLNPIPEARRLGWERLEIYLEQTCGATTNSMTDPSMANVPIFREENVRDVHYLKNIKVLIIFANPKGTNSLRLGEEWRAINQAIKMSKHRDLISIVSLHAATVHDLRQELLNNSYHIIHISSHGDSLGLFLETETGEEYRVPQTGLAELFKDYSAPKGSIECVLLNACYSSIQGELISLGSPYTIVMDGPLKDNAAIEFSRGFYDAIGAGKDIALAYQEGCRAVSLSLYFANFKAKIITKESLRQSGKTEMQAPNSIDRPLQDTSDDKQEGLLSRFCRLLKRRN